MRARSVALALLLLALALPPGAEANHDGKYAECRATAPFYRSCSLTVVPPIDVEVYPIHPLAFAGDFTITMTQFGVPRWNATCLVPLGFFDTGVGFCAAEDGRKPRFEPGAPVTFYANLTVTDYGHPVGNVSYGVGTFGVRVGY